MPAIPPLAALAGMLGSGVIAGALAQVPAASGNDLFEYTALGIVGVTFLTFVGMLGKGMISTKKADHYESSLETVITAQQTQTAAVLEVTRDAVETMKLYRDDHARMLTMLEGSR